MTYSRMLQEGHEAICQIDPMGRLEYLGELIFGFSTYESGYSRYFAIKALDVCKAINEQKTFEYIESPENRLWYLLMVNMPFFVGKLEYGTSIRGAWWKDGIKFDSCGLWLDGQQLHETMEFTGKQWGEFVSALIEFGGMEGA